jgi:16S rRNA (adenine1518-N6/adenine1519-N6)-dimethyltransferase
VPRNTGARGGSGSAPRKKSWSSKKSATPVGAKKSLGQNFLRDQAIADAIVAAAKLAPEDTVIEIGPGPGVLTGRLATQAGRLIAIELDDRFAAQLLARYADTPKVQVVHADVLETDLSALAAGQDSTLNAAVPAQWKSVANIPYYITSPIIRHLLETSVPPSLAVLMVQKEVAERICAEPGDLSLLAVSVQLYATPELLFPVPASAFTPQPKVDSAVLRLVPHSAPLLPDIDREKFFEVVRAGFSQKRKQLANSLSAALQLPKAEVVTWLTAAGIDPERRAETLSIDEWGTLVRQRAAAA